LQKKHFENKDESDNTFQNEFRDLLKKTTNEKTKRNTVEDKKYKDLTKGRFKVIKVTRIENESYEDSIYGKVTDFTYKTIESLIERGKQDARRVLGLG
jgi:hypothetical protein